MEDIKDLKDFSKKENSQISYVFPVNPPKGDRRVSVSVFKGKVRVDFREFYKGDGEDLLPSKKGISFDITQYEKIKELIPMIDEAIRDLSNK